MRINIDLDSNLVIAAPGLKEAISGLAFKRDTAAELAVVFWKNGARVALPDGATGQFGIKANGKFDGSLLVFAEAWTQTGTGADAVYTFEPDFNSAVLAELLYSGDGNETNDIKTLSAISEIKWIVSGKKNRTQTIPTLIENDILKDSDATPTPLPSPIGNTAPENCAFVFSVRDSATNLLAVASSADGTKLVGVGNYNQIYTSTDSGITWTARDAARNWVAAASSADGTKLVATVNNGRIYTSTDSGLTWTARDAVRNWQAVASSADGTKLVAAVSAGQIYTSTDSGLTWTALEANRSWQAVASSADGTKLVAVVYDGQIYTSANSGQTWTARDSVRYWQAVASSDDGTKLVATVISGPIYTSTGQPTLAPPYIRVENGIFYIQDNGIWKQRTLYDIS
jgi:hypothetical protein